VSKGRVRHESISTRRCEVPCSPKEGTSTMLWLNPTRGGGLWRHDLDKWHQWGMRRGQSALVTEILRGERKLVKGAW
jgi:hypothetical protein